jgi:hypothetical protein
MVEVKASARARVTAFARRPRVAAFARAGAVAAVVVGIDQLT